MVERLLIVGRGSIGSRHLRLARALLPQARIAVLGRARPVPEGQTRPDETFTDLGAALRFAPDAAVIANPATHHVASALPLARLGTHLLIEKPLSDCAAGVAELLAAAANATLLVGYNLRFLPSLIRFRREIAAGTVGRPLSVRAEVGQYLPSWRPGSDYRDTVSARTALGGGVLLELSHEFDYLRWLFGDVAWISATASRQSALEIDTEDTAHVVLGFAGPAGGPALVARVDLDFIRQDSTRTCVVIGDAGTLKWDALAGTVSLYRAGAQAWDVLEVQPPQRDGAYLAEWRHFLDCIAGRAAPDITGADGLAVVRIVEAAKRSSREGAVVRLA